MRFSLRAFHKAHRGRGSVLVEFILVMPLFILLVFGSLETASMFHYRQVMLVAANDGALRLARMGVTPEDVEEYVTDRLSEMGIFSAEINAELTMDGDARVTVTEPVKDLLMFGVLFDNLFPNFMSVTVTFPVE